MRRCLVFVAAAVVIGWSLPAAAQPGPGVRPERPYRGLFGSGVGDASQSLIGSLRLSGGYDEDLLSAARGRDFPVDEDRQRAGVFGGAQAGLRYQFSLPRFSVNASYGATGRYFDSFAEPLIVGQGASAGVSMRLTEDVTAQAGHRTTLQPYYAWTPVQDPFDDEDVTGPPDLDFILGHESFLRHNSYGSVGWNRSMSPRASLSSRYSIRRQDAEGIGERLIQSAGASFRYGLSRDLGVRLGYSYRVASYYGDVSDDRRFADHIVDAGVDFNKALSFSRRTVLSFSTGSAITSHDGDRTRIRLSGQARLTHEIGRTWTASLGYGRGWRYADTFEAPVFSDSVSVGLAGLISRRLQFTAGAAATSGGVGFSERNGFTRSSASAGLMYGLNQFVAMSVSYVYYRHDFDPDVVLPPGVLPSAERQGVRAGISFMTPIFQRSRRPDAAR